MSGWSLWTDIYILNIDVCVRGGRCKSLCMVEDVVKVIMWYLVWIPANFLLSFCSRLSEKFNLHFIITTLMPWFKQKKLQTKMWWPYLNCNISLSNPSSIGSKRAHGWGLGLITHTIGQENIRLRTLMLLSATLSFFLLCLSCLPLFFHPLQLFRSLHLLILLCSR